jgi:carbonic anhydrase
MPFSKLIKGFRQFQTEYFGKESHLYDDLVQNGQAPEALVIACSDSRNDPALITRSEPGDIFVVRNVAAIVPPYSPDGNYHGTSAAIEFAVKGLKVPNIVVLGHALCGGVRELARNRGGDESPFEFLTPWIQIGAAARDAVARDLADAAPEIRHRALEQAVILTSLNNLMTFPWIRERVNAGETTLHGWYFDMVAGQLLGYDYGSGVFAPMEGVKGKFAQHTKGCGCENDLPLDALIRSYA